MDLLSMILIIGATLITGGAQAYISLNYRKYKQIAVKSGKSGFDVAREILDRNGLSNVMILETQGELTDHYDPSKKVVKLSHDIYNGQTIAAVSVASHECGHAIQDKNGYAFLRFRNKIVPLVNLSSKFGYIAIMAGIALSMMKLIWVGIAFEVVILLFQLITLPVEFNASSRALKLIQEYGIVSKDEHSGAKKMLTSAALTYVAGVLSTLMEILRFVTMFIGRDRR
jgi:Zn-dependent membrane protease YugP